MRLPEVTLRGIAAFRDWYDRIVTTFFDEVHDIKTLEVTCNGDTADVKLLVNWQAKVWVPPSAKSQWIGFNAGQTWLVRRSRVTGEPVIAIYGVDTFIPMPGSSELPVLAREVIGQYYQALSTGDTAACAALAADDVVVDDAVAGHAVGAAKVAADILGSVGKSRQGDAVTAEHIVVQGSKAVAVWNAGAEVNGATYFEVEDGRITAMRRIYDPAHFTGNAG